MDFNSSLNALALLLIGGSVLGIASLCALRVGVDYMMSRGNPRSRAQAHESLIDMIKGGAVIGGVVLGFVTLTLTTLHIG